MTTRSRVEDRAHRIYEFLSGHLGERFTIGELCRALDIADGSTTRSAIRRARDLATEAGLHFPPAVPQNDFRYMVTGLGEDALDPTLHMSRIAQGVVQREQTGIRFLEQERRRLPSDYRPIVDLYINSTKTISEALAALQRQRDDFVVDMVKIRKEQRAGGTSGA